MTILTKSALPGVNILPVNPTPQPKMSMADYARLENEAMRRRKGGGISRAKVLAAMVPGWQTASQVAHNLLGNPDRLKIGRVREILQTAYYKGFVHRRQVSAHNSRGVKAVYEFRAMGPGK